MDIAYIHSLFLNCSSAAIDTRKIEPNSLFIALRGENFDANTFAKEALEKGAAYVVIDDENYFIDSRTLLVENSLIALQLLAKYHRQYLKTPIIALTGSNGKTTTKELINVVLAKKFKTKATVGNLNNHIGVPLTLLSFDKNTELGIVEMGANHQKEIEFLCDLALPDYGYITNFGKAHLEGFGGIDGVIKGKSEMYKYIVDNEKLSFINLDDDIQAEKSSNFKNFSFGVNNENADINISSIDANPFVEIRFSDFNIQTHLIGLYNANNINAAIAIGKYFEVDDLDIKEALESYIPENNRSQIITRDTNKIILDAYNANPSSMAVAIENFLQLNDPNKIMILGDMFELGSESPHEHKTIINLSSSNNEVNSYFIGKEFYCHKVDGLKTHFFESFESFSVYLQGIKIENSSVLIKGSRGMALERTLNFL
jgi:UDP-N-acetylmuramoyl-tripeptide--D-alanyl-D-alanine ligase